MTTIVTRAGKGMPLSWTDMDANLNNLNDDKLEAGFPASDVANTPAGSISATDVQAAINELDADKLAVGGPATSVSNTPAGGIVATNVQAAINELDGDLTTATNELASFVVKKTASTGAAIVPIGTTGQRPESPVEGHLRRNSELGQWEGYDGSNWTGIGVTSYNSVTSVAGKTGAVTLVKGDVGLGNVDDTADASKTVAYAHNAGSLGGVAAASYSQTSHHHNGVYCPDTKRVTNFTATFVNMGGGENDPPSYWVPRITFADGTSFSINVPV